MGCAHGRHFISSLTAVKPSLGALITTTATAVGLSPGGSGSFTLFLYSRVSNLTKNNKGFVNFTKSQARSKVVKK